MLLNLRTFFEKIFVIVFFVLFLLDFLTGANTGTILPRYFYQSGFLVFLVFLVFFIICKFRHFILYSSISVLFLIFYFFNFFIDFFWLNDFSYEKILKNAYLFLWFLLICFGAYLAERREGLLFGNSFYVFLYFSFFVSLYGFFYYRNKFDIDLSASIYSTLVFFPLLLLQKNNILKKLSLIFLIVLVIISFKRGAILCLFLSLFSCWFLSIFLKLSEKEILKKFFLFFTALFSLGFVLYFVNIYFDNRLLERFSPQELSDGSGRGESNSSAIEYIKTINDPFVFMFGRNDYVISNFLGHNDWLVYFINNGLIICILMAFIYILMIFRIYNLLNSKSHLVYSYTSLFIISILMSMYSTSFGPTFHPMLIMLTLGILESEYKRLGK